MTVLDGERQEKKRSILKSTTLLGGSSLVTILIGMIRTKFVAILLGPTGIGFMGVLGGLQQIVQMATGIGLSSSGVRQIAKSVGMKNEKGIAITVRSLRILVWATGTLGLAVMVIGRRVWSELSFKTTEYSASIAVLGLAVLLAAISSGQSCVLQGLRRISDVAKVNIIGAVTGTIIGLPCYYFWGLKGIVPSLVFGSLATLIASWWYSRKNQIDVVPMGFQVLWGEAKHLILFGLPLMLSGLISSSSGYLIRVFLSREAGLEAAGIYQSAFALAGVLVNFVLGAMGTDYYPRLTAIANDNKKVSEEVNAQTEIALLVAVPGLIATIAFMPFIIRTFYSAGFDRAIPIFRWAIVGILGRIISWPLGFIILAKAKGGIFFIVELISGLIHIGAIVVCYNFFGLTGCGIAYAILYIWQVFFMLVIAQVLGKTKWTSGNSILIGVSGASILALIGVQLTELPLLWKDAINIVSVVTTLWFFGKRLIRTTGINLKGIMERFSR
jgi:antigen flippase